MSFKKSRKSWYFLVLLVFFFVFSSLLAETKIFNYIGEFSADIVSSIEESFTKKKTQEQNQSQLNSEKTGNALAAAPFFATIIANADETVTCSNDGATLARFNLCGNFDTRVIALDQAYSSYLWERLTVASCPSFNADLQCPTYTCSTAWVPAGTSPTLTIDPNSVPAGTGAEFRVRVNGGLPYYIKVKKSTISQTYVKRDYICGVAGRIQVTNLSSAYEYAINDGSGFGAWQGAIFDDLIPGTYIVKARLKNTPNTCEYPYEPIVIESKEIDIDVTVVDAQCFGENGSIAVQVNDVPGPYKYTLLDSSGFPQEFTSFIASDTYNFAAVGFGTYSVQVETQQCKADPANGIAAPRQDVDTSGNPIVIGNGLVALSASTEVNSSFGCADITSVDIIVRTSGGAAPYTFTVNGAAAVSPTYTGQTTYTVTASGDYNFLITDTNGCTITASANVKELTPPVVSASGVDGTCTNGGAKINFNVTDAKGYNLSFRTQPSDPWVASTQISVVDGTYNNLEVRYEQGSFSCTMTLPSVTVTSDASIAGTVTKLGDETCDGIGGTDGGSIQFGTASGGSGSGYEYSVDGVNYTTTPLFSDLAAGTYTPIIRDDSGCRLELTPIVIDQVDPPTNLDFLQSNINCASGTTDLQLTPTSAVAIANYSIISPTAVDNGSSDSFTGLSTTTTYTFRITDANGCIYTESFTPIVTSSIRARAKAGGDLKVCNGASDGSGAFIIDGFSTNYTYQINAEPVSAPQSAAQVDISSRGAGTYTITVTDGDTGCTDTASVTVEESAAITLAPTVTAMSCANGNIGRVVANTTGGWGSYRYTLQRPNGTTVGPTSNRTFGNLTQASTPTTPYILSVEDAEGCTTTFEFQLTPLTSPTISIASSSLCYEPVAGASATVAATGGGGSYEYRINNGTYQASPSFTNLTPGTHTFEVKDVNNCTDTVQLTINAQLRVSIAVETEIPCGGAPGEIRVNISNGYLANASPKQYQVSDDNGATFGAFQPFTSNSFLYPVTTGGDYIFRVTDNEACVAVSEPLVVEDPANIIAAHTVIPASCGDPNSGGVQIIPDATSGIPPFEIDFGNTGTYSSQTVYTGLTAGTNYGYTVRDARGCVTLGNSVLIPAAISAAPDATVSSTDTTCNPSGENSGTIEITAVTDGTPEFTYIVYNSFGVEILRVGPTTSTVESISSPLLVAGDYTVRTVDALGCSDVDAVTISQIDLTVVPDLISVPPSCSVTGFTNTVSIIGGVGPNFLIRLTSDTSAPITPNDPPRRHEFTGLQFGVTYTVEVTDLGTGCIYFQEIPPTEGASPLSIGATSPTAFCDDAGNGRTEFTVSDFVGPITIDLIDPLTDAVLQTDTAPTATPGTDYLGFFDIVPGRYTIRVTDGDTCTDATIIDVILNTPNLDIVSNIPANCNALGQLTVRGSGGAGGPYSYAFVPAGTPPDKDGTLTPTDDSDDFTSATTAVLQGSIAGIAYDIWVIDSRGCTFNVSEDIILLQPPLPAPIAIVNNQCAASASSFDITVTMPGATDTPNFTLNGEEKFGVYNAVDDVWEALYTVNTPGSYAISVVDANGCIGTGTADVYEFLSGTGKFTGIPICNNNDGTITIETNGGSGNFTFELQDDLGNPIGGTPINTTGVFVNQSPGEYLVLITDDIVGDGTRLCTTLVPVNLDIAVPPVIDIEFSEDISCNNSNDGSITIILQAGTDVDGPIDYILRNTVTNAVVQTNTNGVFNVLSEGTYQVEVLSARNCSTLSSVFTITNPAIFEISATSTPFTCEIGANRFSSSVITVAIDQVGTVGSGYQYSITGYENYQDSNTFEIIDDGSTQTITVYAIDGNGCRDEFTLPAIAPPSEVQSVLVVLSPLNCEDPETVRITVTGTADFTIETTSAVAVADVTNSGGNQFVDVDLPVAGEYLFVVRDNVTTCLYPLPRHDVVDPINPLATISEAKPVQCFGDSNGELFISVINYTGEYEYNVYRSDDLTQTTSIANGTFNTVDFPDVSGDDARITGLPGGNFYVRVRAIDNPKCIDDSNVTNIRTPNGALLVSTVEIDNVSCTDNTGKIVATGVGGWDSSPYGYRLLRKDATGTITIGSDTYIEVVAYGTANEFTDLPSGDYRVEIQDVELCANFSEITLAPVDPIIVGIREPQGLVCPDGNDAVLEAYDTTTGTSDTATAGASGGVPGAGYKYQLLYLNSDDNTDVLSRSGLQDTPTFDGVAGGFISEGWYAIEVSSSYECVGVSIPYYVIAPPPLDPKLVQVTAPGCGGDGQMRLSVENPQVGFTYEYRSIDAAASDPFTPMSGTSVLIDGGQGFYQYDVRKVGGAGACTSLRSEGITLVDAQAIDLVANLPDDISCATENDGRIESFSSGGVGNEMYTLYLGNPTPTGSPYTGFNPDPAATVVRAAQTDGTFEGLADGTYYIAVTSGLTCYDVEGPLVISRPEAIVYNIITTNVLCNGDDNGTITIEVTSGGEGLLQFAINPNYNEFFSDPSNPGVYTFENLAAGADYEILIQDTQGCGELVMVAPITEPDVLSISDVVTQPEICLNAYDGEARLTIIGGTPFTDALTFARYYETRIEGINIPIPDPADPTEGFVRNDDLIFPNLQGGESYTIYVRDFNNCTTERVVNIGLGVNLESVAIPQYGCEGIFPNSTVTVEMTDTSILSELLFSLDVDDMTLATSTRTFGDLPAGDHTVYIYHSNGCMDQVSFTIDEYMPLTLSVTKTGPDEITAIATGGYGNYEYSFQGKSQGSVNTFNLIVDATVDVRVEDERGCVALVKIPFNFDSMVEFPNFFTPNGDDKGDTWAPYNREYFPYIDVKIYDRYGRVVAVLDQIKTWDGMYEGNELPTGDYWYVVNANDADKQQYVGHFTLYR
ncbi:T9SS type B sorting domain-containing protein [Cellulophaga sp. E16_2]|uniref:T9SS type B sorting domain-containing protein n=1 Tax=Cellulophaga sp. E16_2 TaxID=2789297 RepID=UPI001A90D6D3|nr:T9SS type B sorting domain-containing protein [Cellulophaga sp. E16_2]MBO0592454.1 T9SS type B sorting domain-containing protein [Cellulophaga sp. E16_2]